MLINASQNPRSTKTNDYNNRNAIHVPSLILGLSVSVLFAIVFVVGQQQQQQLGLSVSSTRRTTPSSLSQGVIATDMAEQLSFELSKTLRHEFQMLKNATKEETSTACRHDNLPKWVTGGPIDFQLEMERGSTKLTDKVDHQHKFQYPYQLHLAQLIRRKLKDTHPKIRMLEIGLGCAPNGGMLRRTPGGSALGWNHLFRQVPGLDFELHILELDAACAQAWAQQNPGLATVHVGDQSSRDDLLRVVHDSGGEAFDVVIDDGSHRNEHQIRSFQVLISHVAPNGYYFIEDIGSSCRSWRANMGSHIGPGTGGTAHCMTTTTTMNKEGNSPHVPQPTVLAFLMEYQRHLVGGDVYRKWLASSPTNSSSSSSVIQRRMLNLIPKHLHGVTSIHIHFNIFVISKEVEKVI